MKNLKASVIITVYNEDKSIESCLKSLIEQDYKPLEIIVINDGSTDKTSKILRKFNLITYELPHEGTAVSRNFAAKKATGEILVFLDADMEFEKNFITKLIAPINKQETKGTFSKLEYVKNWEKPLARCWNRVNTPKPPDGLRVRQDLDVGDDFRAILKSEFEKASGFDNVGYTDTWTLSKKLAYKSINATGAIYYHNNPETYGEIFQSAQWIGKRKYKLGKIGNLITILRCIIFISLGKGLLRALKYNEPVFIPFQVIYDLGITKGALFSIFSNRIIK